MRTHTDRMQLCPVVYFFNVFMRSSACLCPRHHQTCARLCHEYHQTSNASVLGITKHRYSSVLCITKSLHASALGITKPRHASVLSTTKTLQVSALGITKPLHASALVTTKSLDAATLHTPLDLSTIVKEAPRTL